MDRMIRRVCFSLCIAASVVTGIDAARRTRIYAVPRRLAVGAMISSIRITLCVASPIVARINTARWATRPGYGPGWPPLNRTRG